MCWLKKQVRATQKSLNMEYKAKPGFQFGELVNSYILYKMSYDVM